MDDLIEKARIYAIGAHARINQLRKYTRQPYDVHLKAVAELVASVSDDEAMIAAAWLHDTVEDTPATFEDLEREFGADVMQLVNELTDVSRPGDGGRAARKAIDRQHPPGRPAGKDGQARRHHRQLRRYLPPRRAVRPRVPGRSGALLEVLKEGDERLYGRAVELVASYKDKLGLVPAGIPCCGARRTSTGGGKPARAGQHGIRLFMEAFAARDILEPLLSFDAATIALPRGDWPWAHLTIAGARENGATTGYLIRDVPAGAGPLRIRGIDQRQLLRWMRH